MSNKRNDIIAAALDLFSEKGYAATSTASIAQAASVSEGLIFRHFKNKRGLVEELLQQSDERYQNEIQQFISAEDPADLLRAFIDYSVHTIQYVDSAKMWITSLRLSQELGIDQELRYAVLLERLAWALGAIGHGKPTDVARTLISAQEGMLASGALGHMGIVESIAAGMRELVLNE